MIRKGSPLLKCLAVLYWCSGTLNIGRILFCPNNFTANIVDGAVIPTGALPFLVNTAGLIIAVMEIAIAALIFFRIPRGWTIAVLLSIASIAGSYVMMSQGDMSVIGALCLRMLGMFILYFTRRKVRTRSNTESV